MAGFPAVLREPSGPKRAQENRLQNRPRSQRQGGFADRARPDTAQQTFQRHAKAPRPRLTPEKDVSQHDGIVVKLVACGKDERHGRPACPGAQFGKFIGVVAQLRRIATAELRPTCRIVTEPFAQRRARRKTLDPEVDGRGGFSHPARPKPVDQYPRAVTRRGRQIGPFEPDPAGWDLALRRIASHHRFDSSSI